ncbi:MAG: class I SAM-dependent methyltransferase [Candidatus Gribaldobacteria bacterium]|nr:class I SAM-dependent methyltransferase [Candidatus Gribaldobacteria bacterium]
MFLNPNDILDQMGLTNEMKAADFGSGSGGWAISLAKKLKDGSVLAIDLQEEPLSVLMSEAKHQGIGNIKPLVADLEKPVTGLLAGSCDFVLICNVLFQVDDKSSVLSEAFRALKSGGTMLIVEWKLETPLGPKDSRLSVSEVEELALSAGFTLQKDLPAGLYHFALLFKKL